jgi:hypothetical protein
MAITEFSGTPPSLNQSQPDFDTNNQAFVNYVTGLAPELNEFAAALNTFATTSTSSTSLAVSVGSKSLTVEAGKSYFPGQSLTIARTSDTDNRMFAVVDSYNSGTGALVVTSQAFEGSGTFTDWTITLGFNGVISTGQIANNAVETAKVADGAITRAKLANGVISTGQIANNAVETAKVADGAITRAKLASDTIPRNYINGLTLSTAGASTTMAIAAGVAADSTNAVMMTLAAAISKTTASWAVGTGNGGLDTGTIANNTWYHFYEIRRPDTGVVDVLFSLSASSPTLPANYTQFRRIGSGLTNGSGRWVKFFQFDDEFWWDAPVDDISTQVQGTTPIDYALTVPTGLRVKAIGNPAYISDGIYIYTPDFSGDTPTTGSTPAGPNMSSGGAQAQLEVWTNTSAQIRADGSTSGRFIYWKTLGWKDMRGRNA